METKRISPNTSTATPTSSEKVSSTANKYMLRNASSSVKKHLKFDDETGRKSKKRKRISKTNEKMKNIINNIEKEIEEQLDLQTEENDFITTNVKAILKEIIVDEDIKEMVRKTLHPKENVTCYEPKLTRAKVRELLKVRPDLSLPMLWPIPTKNTNFVSECLSLINEDFSENSSEDEEYKPDDDDKSEYADSLFPSECDNLESERGLNDSFDLPDGPHDIGYVESEIEENICHRTRSKLPLTETPLEVIEQSFVPPDITSDMYETVLDKEDVWYNFLTGFLQPIDRLNLEHTDVDDDPEDPEYTIQADEETVDREELRKDKAVEVPSNEVEELIVELLRDCEPPYSNKKVSEAITSYENRSSCSNVEVASKSVEVVEKESPASITLPRLPKSDCPILTESQKLLVQQHLRQHVQLTLTHFLQCYKHPTLFVYANRMKTILESLRTLAGLNKKSYFYACNLDSALKLIAEWEQIRADDPMPTTILTQKGRKENNPDEFSVLFMKLVCKSNAFVYPLMLPEKPFCHKVTTNIHKRDMGDPEEWLLASGLQQFTDYTLNTQKTKNSSNPKWETVKLISQYLFSNQFTPTFLRQTVKRKSSENTNNSIKYYLKHNRAPPLKHYIIPVCMKPLCQQPLELLPRIWRNYVEENFVIVFAANNSDAVHQPSSKDVNS